MRYMNISSKICNFSMKKLRNIGMMQRMNVCKVTIFVSLIKGLNINFDCIKSFNEYILKVAIFKRYMITDMYSVRNGMYICSDGIQNLTECMQKLIVYNCWLYATTKTLIQSVIETLYVMNIWIHTMTVCRSSIYNYNHKLIF